MAVELDARGSRYDSSVQMALSRSTCCQTCTV